MIPAHIAAWKMKKEDDMALRRYNYSGSSHDSGPTQVMPAGYIVNPNRGYVGGRDAVQPPQYIPGPAPAGYQWRTPQGHDSGSGQPQLVAKGGGSSPRVPSPMEEAQASLFLEQERDKIKKANDLAAKAAADEEKRQLGITAAGKQTAAYNTARGYGGSQLSAKGYNQGLLDKYNVLDQYYGDIENQKAGFDPYDISPDFNTSTALSNAISSGQGSYRNDITKAINAAAGTGFEKNLIGDTMDDTILQAILGKQKGTASGQIEAAWKRGQLSDQGYSAALEELGTAEKTGMGQLQNIGQGVLGGYRTGLTNAKNTALQTAGGLTLADLYDINAFNTGLTGQVNTAKAGLEGDIYGAVGDQQFFDPTKIIAGAGANQGFYNPSQAQPLDTTKQVATGSLFDLMTEEEKKKTAATTTPTTVF